MSGATSGNTPVLWRKRHKPRRSALIDLPPEERATAVLWRKSRKPPKLPGMGRRSNILDIAVGGAIVLFFALHTIFNILFEEWVKQQLHDRFGVTAAEMIERFGAV